MTVFLPATGIRIGGDVYNVGDDGGYWSSTPGGDDGAYNVTFGGGSLLAGYPDDRYNGRSVRLVQDI